MQDSWDMDLMALETPLPRTVLNSSLQTVDLDSFNVFGTGLNTSLNTSLEQPSANSELEQACQSLSKLAADLAQLLSLFAATPMSWNLVELVTDALQWNQSQVDLARIELHSMGLLQFTSNGYCTMKPSIKQYLLTELENSSQASLLKQAVATVMASVAKQIVTAASGISGWDIPSVMPHLAEAARNMVTYFSDESAQWCFLALGGFSLKQQSYGEAKDWYSQCLSISLERFGSVHPAVVTSLNNLAYLYTQQGYFDQALPLYWKALDLCQQVFGGNHLSVATSLNNLAGLYNLQERYSEAEALYQQALQIKKQLLGEKHLSVATSLNNLAGVYYSQGRYDRAETLYQQALRLRQCLQDSDPMNVVGSLSNLANVFHAQGKQQRSLTTLKQALQLAEQKLGVDHPETIFLQQNLQVVQSSKQTTPLSLLQGVREKLTSKR